MTKRHLKVLEKIYAAEISGALNHTVRIAQVKGKAVDELVEMGLIKKVTETLPGRFPVKIEGYELTLLGNITYCSSC